MSLNHGVLFAVVAVVGYILYRAALPSPIHGIPHNTKSARRILGDIPEMLRWKNELGNAFGYFPWLTQETTSPIVQVFLRPLGRPWVIVVDPRESHDIMTRRYAEFDRSKFFGDTMKAMGREFHAHFPTDRKWTAHRRLIGDTMSTGFLHNVAGPQMWKVMQSVVDLWQEKARLAGDRSFDAAEDIKRAALDIVWSATFGSETGTIKAQRDLLGEVEQLDIPADTDAAVDFPAAADPQACASIVTVMNSIRIPLNSLFPQFHHWFALKYYPYLVAAGRHKDEMIGSALKAAEQKFSTQKLEESVELTAGLTCAVDLVTCKEIKMAQKEGRAPLIDSRVIRDELFGFMLGGYETTSTNACWGLKFLIKHQDVQDKLRTALRSGFQRASQAGENPTIEEITTTNIAYLDAVIAEVMRCSIGAVATIRVATVDTQILGYAIPKGTDVFFMNNGPGKLMEPIEVQESRRSNSSQEAKNRTGAWDPSEIALFRPERWLASNEGESEFAPLAGPAHPFGAGPRGCFGRKWALLEMRIIFVLTFWSFELLPTPEPLSSWRVGEQNQAEQMHLRLRCLKNTY
ncbi:Cytochrome P450 monooxygenase [Lachnellula occidentalis]|uniref:Cytochrome P450 monooxygenase n=1 Tax=Lachnellula occidentalis TaxID=215460 RepID=A0A8H8S199_9HELO|nr:Cytochrome P450 monooxygenase [Lachnellula occidentalis]